MHEGEFVAANRASWNSLETLAGLARQRGIASFSGDQLRSLHSGYMTAVSDLAYAQTHFPSSSTTAYLNDLVSGVYALIYTSNPRRVRRVMRFLIFDYPHLIREKAKEIGLATAIFLLTSVIGFALPFSNPRLAKALLPELYEPLVEQLEKGQIGGHVPASLGPLLSSQIMVNNIQVSFVAFAGGILFGALTVFTLARNGLLLGELAGLVAKYGFSLQFWSLILPHGILELPAIWITAGGGLLIGRALIRPGDDPRSAALKRAAHDAVRLVLGTIPVFVVAGLIEAFFTPAEIEPWIKLLASAAFGMAFAAFILLAGRRAESNPPTATRRL